MEVKISPRAMKYLQERGASSLVLGLVDIETGGSVGAARDVAFGFTPPRDSRHFRWCQVEGIDVYVDRKLKVVGPVVIKKQGFWKLSSLYADGVQVPI